MTEQKRAQNTRPFELLLVECGACDCSKATRAALAQSLCKIAPHISVKATDNPELLLRSLEGKQTTADFILVFINNSNIDAKLLKAARANSRSTFVCMFGDTAANSAALRQAFFDLDCNMVGNDPEAVVTAVRQASSCRISGGRYECPFCGLKDLSENELCLHAPLYHSNFPMRKQPQICTICNQNVGPGALGWHLHNEHGPVENREHGRSGAPLYPFALVVCRRSDGRFLLVQEFCNSGFWLPGGGVDGGEDLDAAAIRETKEEAGIDVELTGILRLEYSPCKQGQKSYSRLRAIFMGKPKDEAQLPKSLPDYESVGAVWAHVEEIDHIRLRGGEPAEWFQYVANGGPVFPLSLLTREGAPAPHS